MGINIVIFASGSGSNAEALVKYFLNSDEVNVSAIFSNKANAYVLERAKNLSVASEVFKKTDFTSEVFLEKLKEYNADFIVLAGFLWKLPDYLVHSYSDKIINIHPSLLPKYGGKGMYGSFVHEAVIQNEETESGITIHLVNEHYDEGRVLFQATCDVTKEETPDSLAAKIHQLEHKHFPEVVHQYIKEFVAEPER